MGFPSHSIHTLQPLDVGLFSSLGSYYSSTLAQIQQQSQGLLKIKKRDFYGLFKSAYASSFTSSNIISAFTATGIWPGDRTVVTDKFKYTTPPLQTDPKSPSHLSPADWKRIEEFLDKAVKDRTKETAKKLKSAIHRAATHTKLLEIENEGLLTSLDTKNKRTRHSSRLPLADKKNQPTDGVFYSLKS